MQSWLCNLSYAILAVQSRLCDRCCAIQAMQSLLCNLGYASEAMQSRLCNLMFWKHLGVFWEHLGAFGGVLGAFWGQARPGHRLPDGRRMVAGFCRMAAGWPPDGRRMAAGWLPSVWGRCLAERWLDSPLPPTCLDLPRHSLSTGASREAPVDKRAHQDANSSYSRIARRQGLDLPSPAPKIL